MSPLPRIGFALAGRSYGEEWSAAKLAELLGDNASLESWLRDRFFEEHCELFQQRPFVWHVWDGRKDGFNALVNYHKLAAPNGDGRKTLEKLIYTTLGDWITRQRADVTAGVDGADGRLAARPEESAAKYPRWRDALTFSSVGNPSINNQSAGNRTLTMASA